MPLVTRQARDRFVAHASGFHGLERVVYIDFLDPESDGPVCDTEPIPL